jgi:diguanylate cyclase
MEKKKSVGRTVADMLDSMGISAIPRNYALIYTYYTSGNRELADAVDTLGVSPRQDVLDGIIRRFLPDQIGEGLVQRQQMEMIKSLEMVIKDLQKEETEMNSFSGAVGKLSETLARRIELGEVSPEALLSVAGALVDTSRQRVANSARSRDTIGENRDAMEEIRGELERQRVLANTDDLTQLANKRAFDEMLAKVYSRDTAKDFGLLVLDIDHFKRINDNYGHAGGNKILSIFANCLRKNVRPDSFVARTGGEEFAVIVRKAGAEQLAIVAERLRKSVESLEFKHKGEEIRITVSLGGCLATEADNPEAIFEFADQALYQSKNGGRNRVTMFELPALSSSNRYQMYATK